MTLLEIERLARKISEITSEHRGEIVSPKLAEDYAAACRAANLRLLQCEAMLKAGDRHQALQLAETSPKLRELIELLEFPNASEWRALCAKQGLPAAEKPDAQAAQTLRDCYAQGITTDNPLYAEYRRAVLRRDDQAALKCLQSIVRLNPSDSNAASELDRLDKKVLSDLLKQLEPGIGTVLADGVVEQIEAIEAFGFKQIPEGEVWRRAQTIRCEWLVQKAAQERKEGRWKDALEKMELFRRLEADFKLVFSPKLIDQAEALDRWVRNEEEKDRKEREFNSLLAELHYRVQQSEEKDTSARFVKLPEMKSDNEAIHKVWRALQDFTRPIPADASSRFLKRSGLLEAEINRRVTMRRRLTFLVAFAALLIISGISWVTMRQLKAHEFAREMKEVAAKREVGAAEKLIEQITQREQGLLHVASLDSALSATEEFVSKEHELEKGFGERFEQVSKALVEEPSTAQLESLAAGAGAAQSAFDQLAPEFKTQNSQRWHAFQTQWSKVVTASSATANAAFEKQVKDAEKLATAMDYQITAEQARERAAALANAVRGMGEFAKTLTNILTPRSDLLQRAKAVDDKFNAFNGQLQRLTEAMEKMKLAREFSDYTNALQMISESEFSASPEVRAATAMQARNPGEESAMRALLNATNATFWTFLNKPDVSRFIPEIAMPAEHGILEQLRQDPAVGSFQQRVRLHFEKGGKMENWIVRGSLSKTQGWANMEVYAPAESPDAGLFSSRKLGYFDGKYRLSPTEILSSIELLGEAKETTPYFDLGIGGLMPSSASGTYTTPLLEVLDRLKTSDEGSPLFRAYLFVRLTDLMELQPDGWGLTCALAVLKARDKLNELAGGQISSGDWFAPAKTAKYATAVQNYFESIRSTSYAKQAAAVLSLDRQAVLAGLKYGGYIEPDGKVRLVEESPNGTLWTYTADSAVPVRLEIGPGGKVANGIRALPLAPIMRLGAPVGDMIAKAGIKPADRAISGSLPPMFDTDSVKQ